MTIKEFEYNTQKLIYDTSAIQINQLIGTSKTSTAAIGLYLQVPIKVTARRVDSVPVIESKKQPLAPHLTAYLKHDDRSTIQFAFFYTKESELKKLSKMVTKQSYYLTYLYLRELFRLMRNHNTLAHYNMVKKHIAKYPQVPVEQYYSYMISASDYSINNYLHELYSKSPLNKFTSKIFDNERYNASYYGKADLDILKLLLNNDGYSYNEPFTITIILDDGTTEEHSFMQDGDSSHFEGFSDFDLKDNDEICTDLGESLSNHLASASRGLGSAQIFKAAFEAVKVNTGWFKELTKSFNREVYYMTDKSHSSWANYNTTYKHKFKAPKRVSETSALNIYLCVDHSGSMSDKDLGKLLYLISKHSSSIAKLTVWIHDTEIVKEYILEASSDIMSSRSIIETLGSREACGGTSHLCIASKLDEVQPDPDDSIFISFSDNYSDIPSAWAKYPHLTSIPTFWVCTVNNPVNVKGTTDILME